MAFNIMDLFAAPAMNRLLQPQQSTVGIPNMLLTRPAPQNYPAAAPAPAVDPTQTAAVAPPAPASVPTPVPAAQPAQPGLRDQFANFVNSDRGQALNDLFTGWAAGSTPSESLAYGAKLTAANKRDREAKNETVAWLKGKGLADDEARRLASSPPALNEYLKSVYEQKKPLEINGQLVDPTTYKVIADYRTPAAATEKDTALIKELKAAGLKEGTPEFQEAILANNRPKGMMIESDGQGGFRMVQGTDVSGGANLNVEQGKNTGFLLRANDANKAIGDLESQGTSIWNNTAGKLPLVGNFALGDNAQKYDQAKRDFVNAVLRQESGAVISPEEFANADRQYFPQPGDSEAVIKQKRQNRENAIAGFRIRSGPGAQSVDKMGGANDQNDPLGLR